MKYFESRFMFDPKVYVNGTKQSAIEVFLQKMETRSRLEFPVKQHLVADDGGFLWWKKQIHTARLIIASPDENVQEAFSDRLPVYNRQTLTVEQLTTELYNSLVPLKLEGTFTMRLHVEHAFSNEAKSTFFYLKNKLKDCIAEENTDYQDAMYKGVALLGPPKTHEAIVEGEKKIITVRHNIGSISFPGTFHVTMIGPLDILLDVRSRFLKHQTRIGTFDVIDSEKFAVFDMNVSPTNEYAAKK